MEKKNILFITTSPNTGSSVYAILPKLNRIHNVDVLNIFVMSKHTKWKDHWEFDPRERFYKMCEGLGMNVFHAPGLVPDKNTNAAVYSKYRSRLDDIFKRNYYDLVVIDNNTHWKRLGLGPLYRYFAEQKIPYLACPHGNKDHTRRKVLKRVGRLYDFSFMYGEKAKRKSYEIEKKYRGNIDKVFPAGIPGNDALKDCKRSDKHILLIMNFTKSNPKGSQTAWQRPFTLDTFETLKLPKLSEKYNCPILIKEKYRIWYNDELSLRKSLKKYKSIVKFVWVAEDDNQMIADSACVISAPSTMSFKPIQLGVPTVILNKFGMNGNFTDWQGMINPSYKEMRKSLKKQEEEGRDVDFISRTISGGVEYNSTDIYIDYINKILEGDITCH